LVTRRLQYHKTAAYFSYKISWTLAQSKLQMMYKSPTADNQIKDFTQVGTLNTTNLLQMLFAVCPILLAGFTVAEARPNTIGLTCSQAQSMVRSHRSILLSTGRYTFDRYVVNVAFCPSGDYAKSAYVQTRDRKSCRIGYTCTMDNPLDFWDD
jgi:hypothetical protein